MDSKQADKVKKGKKLKEMRLFYGLSQRELGERLGTTRGAINTYERGGNLLPKSLMWKIQQIVGIGNEYFESDMTLQEAVEKYNMQPNDIIRIDDCDKIECFVYEGIENYVKDNHVTKDFNLKSSFLSALFDLEHKACYHFIKLNDSLCEPFARNGDILIMQKDTKPMNADFVLTKLQQSYIIFQYLIAGIDTVLFKGNNGIEMKLSGDEIKQVEILGIIKQKITIAM